MGPSAIEMIPASRRLLIRALKSATPSGDKTLNRLLTRASSTVSHTLKSHDDSASSAANSAATTTTMKAWRIHSFTGINSVSLEDSVLIPTIECPYDVLVKVKAASVNPLDVWMARGVGQSAFNAYRSLSECTGLTSSTLTSSHEGGLPLTLGRDFSGVVVDAGMAAGFEPGDEVWGTVFPANPSGSHAEYVAASGATSVSLKPKSLTHIEAASMPYAALTAWSGLSLTGQLLGGTTSEGGKDVLVAGASGGVGTLAVQMLKAHGSRVVAICSDDAYELVSGLGADVVLDYKSEQFEAQMDQLAGKFDAVVDCTGSNFERYEKCLRPWGGSQYITFTSPILPNTDKLGFLPGLLDSAYQLATQNVSSVTSSGATQRWAYFMPNKNALEALSKMCDKGKLRPVVQRVFKFEDMADAYNMQADGHARGKIVVDIS